MISARSSFSSCRPATSSRVTLSPSDRLALLLPKFIILLLALPAPPWLVIIWKKKMHRTAIRIMGMILVRKLLSGGMSRTSGSSP